MFQKLVDALQRALSPDLLTRTLEAGAALLVFAVVLGLALTGAGSALVTGLGGAIGEKLPEDQLARARRTVRRSGALLTVFLALGAATLTGAAAWQERDLAHAILAQATPDRIYEIAKLGAILVGFLVGAGVLVVLLRRAIAAAEARVVASSLEVRPDALRPLAKSLASFAKVVVYLEAVLLALQVAGAPLDWITPVRLVLKLAAIVLGALLLARIVHLVLDALGSLLAEVPERGAFRYLLRLRGLVALGKRSAEYVIYAYGAKLFVHVVDALREVDELGSRVIATIAYTLGARVAVELVSLLVQDVFLGAPAAGTEAPDAGHAEARARTFVPILRSLASYFIYFFSALAVLKIWGVDTAPILASAGILGLAVGLGAQKLTGDLVAGFFILFEGTYFVGHYIVAGDKEGTVESITIRTTSIRDSKGVLHTIPNGSVNVVSNYSTGFVDAVVDLVLSAKADLAAVGRTIDSTGQKLDAESDDVLAPTQVEGVLEVGASEVVLRTRTRVTPGRHEWAKSELRRRIKEALDAEKVEFKSIK